MYYYVYKDNCVEKYWVNFSKEEVEKLKLEIINNCSEIEHHEYEGVTGPNYFDYLRIRNYKERFISIRESRDSLQWPDQKVYHYSYDEYKFPQLVFAIDSLLKGIVDVLDSIFSDNIKSYESIDERINRVSYQLDQIDNLDLNNKRNKLDELQKLVDLKKLNKNQKSIEPYYDKLKELIKIDLVDKISLDEINRVNNFFGREDSVKKTLKK